jgi:hypothetical protein
MSSNAEELVIRDQNDDGVLTNADLAGVGTLADVIGKEEADKYYADLESSSRFLYRLAVRTFGLPPLDRPRPSYMHGHSIDFE